PGHRARVRCGRGMCGASDAGRQRTDRAASRTSSRHGIVKRGAQRGRIMFRASCLSFRVRRRAGERETTSKKPGLAKLSAPNKVAGYEGAQWEVLRTIRRIRMRCPWFLAAVAVVGLSTGAGRAAEGAPAQVTFTEHIAPIIFNNCTACHRPGEGAPFALMDYRDVQKRSKTILRRVERRYMPPWHPEAGHGQFKDERRLKDEQIALLKRWVETGMAEGDATKLPKMPEFTQGWQLGKPDLIVTMAKGYDVYASGRDINRNFVIPLNLTEGKWVTAVEVRPSAGSVVHPVLYFYDTTGEARKLEGKDGQPGFLGMAFRRSGSLGGWAVGATPRQLPPGLAYHLPKGSDLVLQTHFHPAGKAATETTTV